MRVNKNEISLIAPIKFDRRGKNYFQCNKLCKTQLLCPVINIRRTNCFRTTGNRVATTTELYFEKIFGARFALQRNCFVIFNFMGQSVIAQNEKECREQVQSTVLKTRFNLSNNFSKIITPVIGFFFFFWVVTYFVFVCVVDLRCFEKPYKYQ